MFKQPHSGRSILLLGRNPRLAETRGWVFEREGFEVRTFLHLSDLDEIGPSQQIDLFVLCDSLKPDVRRQAQILIGLKWPKAKRLTLTSAGTSFQIDPAEHTFPAIDGPRKLIATIHNLMTDGAAPSL